MQPIFSFIYPAFILLYLAFTFQLFYNYRKKIIQYFSNTYRLELNWILTFLILFTVSFLYSTIQEITGALITDLGYEERWWLNLYVAIITLIVGVQGYFINTTKLNTLDFSFSPKTIGIPESKNERSENEISPEELNTVKHLMEDEKAYLNPELNLSELAEMGNMSRGQLSEVINTGFEQNFNDFVNSYRVAAFKSICLLYTSDAADD